MCVWGVMSATTMKLNLFISYIIRNSSYPKGNFGGNQLLDGSMSLSPLYPDQAATICTSVPHNASFHQVFTWLHHVRAKFTIFRVSTKLLFSLISTRARVSLHKLYTRSRRPSAYAIISLYCSKLVRLTSYMQVQRDLLSLRRSSFMIG